MTDTSASLRPSTAEFLGIRERTPNTFDLPLTNRCTGGGRGSLFGGVGLAAGIAAMETVAGKQPVWATGQYLATLFPPDVLQLDVSLPAVGRSVTQSRVIGTADGREVITVLGAVGERVEEVRGVWDVMPDAASPEDCADVERSVDVESIHNHVEVRIARGMFGFTGAGEPSGDNRTLLWVRMREVRHDAAALAIMADYSPSSLGNAAGRVLSVSSLDNTIRFADLSGHEGGWILCDNRIEFAGNGFAHGSCLMWAEDGVLLAMASQSMSVYVPA